MANPTLLSEHQRAERHLARAVAAEATLAEIREVLDEGGEESVDALTQRLRSVLDDGR